jgi:mono/diheme cytochrome c family protein
VGALTAAIASAPRDALRPDWIAPEKAATRANPLAGRRDVIAGGAKLFRQRCETCHGREAQGFGRAPDLTAEHVQRQSDGALFWKITSGNAYRGMPSFSYLPEPQRWQLVMYLREAASSAGTK